MQILVMVENKSNGKFEDWEEGERVSGYWSEVGVFFFGTR
jgi:hypothetical protein